MTNVPCSVVGINREYLIDVFESTIEHLKIALRNVLNL